MARAQPKTDRGLRYRAAANPPPGPRRCHYCGAGAARNVEVEHVDGYEEHLEPHNLSWACRSCNTKKGIVFRNAGIGRRTRQFNPTPGPGRRVHRITIWASPARRRNPDGARNLAQWLNAVLSLKGESNAMDLPAAIALVHATPHDKRSEFAREIWNRRRQRKGSGEEVPF